MVAAGLVADSSAVSAPRDLAPVKMSVKTPVMTPPVTVAYSLANDSNQEAQEAQQPSAVESASTMDRLATKWQVLVVEDERDVRFMLRSLLELEGFTVDEAADGLEGLALLRASRNPQIVLLDYKMPRMNGEELLHAVRADPALADRDAFIFVTANLLAFSPALRQVVHDAAIPVIQKPYAISTLLEEIDRAAARLAGKGPGPTA